MSEIEEYLLLAGFYRVESGESGSYIQLKTGVGALRYGWEYQVFDGEWRDPTTPALYLWSGLGSSQDYGYPLPLETVEDAKALLLAMGLLVDNSVS
jgi:hypothetical protein